MNAGRQNSPASAGASTGVPSGEPIAGGAAFVGRAAEMAALSQGLHDASEGHGRLFLISGEAGIGKTRLADEFAATARGRGARVLWGRCWEAGGAPVYWPWVQCIRSYLRDLRPEALRDHVGPGGSDLARIVPAVRDILPDTPAPPAVDPETARFRLFDAVTAFVLRAARDQDLVVILDDLHAADTPSLRLLQFLCNEIDDANIVVVGTFRDTEVGPDHPLAETVVGLTRLPAGRHLSLSGITEPQVASLIEVTTGTVASEDVVAAVHGHTDGNPLFVGEVVRLLAAEGRLHRRGPEPFRIAVPAGLRQVIARRLHDLSPECIDVLSVASVLGREFDLAELERVTELSTEALLDLLEQAAGARVVMEAPGVLGRLRFSHALVRDALYEDLPAIRRVRLHRQVAEALEALYGSRAEPPLAELAQHFVRAAPGGDADRAIGYARRAGERAVALLAYEEAVRLFGMALQALELKDPVDLGTRCELLLSLGDAQTRAGNFPAAKATFVQAAEVARSADMPERLARAALGYGGRFIWEGGRDDPNVQRLLEEALAAQGSSESELRLKVMARLAAGPLRDELDGRRRNVLSAEAVSMARRLGDPAALAYALACRCVAAWSPDNVEERLATADELVRVAHQAGDEEREHQGRVWRCFTRWELGDITGTYEDLEHQERLEAELRQPAQMWLGTTSRAALATFEGRFDDAERLASQASATGREAAGPMVPVYLVEQRWALRWQQGRLEEVLPDLRAMARRFPMYPVLRCEFAHACAELGLTPEARHELESLAADGFAAMPRNEAWLFGLCLLADVAERLGDTIRGATLKGLLEPYADRLAAFPTEACLGAVSGTVGKLAAMAGDREAAEAYLDRALDINAGTGGRPWAARTQLDLAAMLMTGERPGDRERAADLLTEALEASRELGMAALAAEVTALLEGIDRGPSPPAEDRSANVFRREGEYWTIVFEGRAFRLRDLKGLHYLARLLADSGREFHVLDLVTAEAGRDAVRVRRPEPGLALSGGDDAGPVLDARAKEEYRRRLADLEQDAEDARAAGDAEQASRAEEERDFLVRELARAVGLGGRDRRSASAAERARVSVTRAIRAALSRIRDQSPELGEHLDRTVRTGVFCSYAPDPRVPVDWQL